MTDLEERYVALRLEGVGRQAALGRLASEHGLDLDSVRRALARADAGRERRPTHPRRLPQPTTSRGATP